MTRNGVGRGRERGRERERERKRERKRWRERKREGDKDRQTDKQEKHNRCACWNIMQTVITITITQYVYLRDSIVNYHKEWMHFTTRRASTTA